MYEKKVLIIDDDPTIHLVLKKRLLVNGYRCVSEYSVKSALKNLKWIKPDLIILDLNFPNESGTTFLKYIRKYLPSDWNVPPIIVLSCNNDDEIVRNVLEIGAIGFIAKPYNPLELVATINNHIREAVPA